MRFIPRFSAERMVRDYVATMYTPPQAADPPGTVERA
jgi:hypothetical protein